MMDVAMKGLLTPAVIDYTKEDPLKAIPRGSIDFVLDTTGEALHFLHLMRPSTSTIVSISTLPSGKQLQHSSMMRRPEKPQVPWIPYLSLNVIDGVSRLRAWRWGVNYQYMFLDPNGKDLNELTTYVEQGSLRPVVGSTVNLNDIDSVKRIAGLVHSGKGGLGKAVIEVLPTS
jgi:NADPH:quinone reductase-like Zn-dependent oxidoreductase